MAKSYKTIGARVDSKISDIKRSLGREYLVTEQGAEALHYINKIGNELKANSYEGWDKKLTDVESFVLAEKNEMYKSQGDLENVLVKSPIVYTDNVVEINDYKTNSIPQTKKRSFAQRLAAGLMIPLMATGFTLGSYRIGNSIELTQPVTAIELTQQDQDMPVDEEYVPLVRGTKNIENQNKIALKRLNKAFPNVKKGNHKLHNRITGLNYVYAYSGNNPTDVNSWYFRAIRGGETITQTKDSIPTKTTITDNTQYAEVTSPKNNYTERVDKKPEIKLRNIRDDVKFAVGNTLGDDKTPEFPNDWPGVDTTQKDETSGFTEKNIGNQSPKYNPRVHVEFTGPGEDGKYDAGDKIVISGRVEDGRGNEEVGIGVFVIGPSGKRKPIWAGLPNKGKLTLPDYGGKLEIAAYINGNDKFKDAKQIDVVPKSTLINASELDVAGLEGVMAKNIEDSGKWNPQITFTGDYKNAIAGNGLKLNISVEDDYPGKLEWNLYSSNVKGIKPSFSDIVKLNPQENTVKNEFSLTEGDYTLFARYFNDWNGDGVVDNKFESLEFRVGANANKQKLENAYTGAQFKKLGEKVGKGFKKLGGDALEYYNELKNTHKDNALGNFLNAGLDLTFGAHKKVGDKTVPFARDGGLDTLLLKPINNIVTACKNMSEAAKENKPGRFWAEFFKPIGMNVKSATLDTAGVGLRVGNDLWQAGIDVPKQTFKWKADEGSLRYKIADVAFGPLEALGQFVEDNSLGNDGSNSVLKADWSKVICGEDGKNIVLSRAENLPIVRNLVEGTDRIEKHNKDSLVEPSAVFNGYCAIVDDENGFNLVRRIAETVATPVIVINEIGEIMDMIDSGSSTGGGNTQTGITGGRGNSTPAGGLLETGLGGGR